MTENQNGARVRATTVTGILLAIGVWCAASASDDVQPESSLADRRAVRAVVQGIIAADNLEDLKRVLSYYAGNAILISPEGADVVGADAIREHYEALFAAVDFTIKTRIDGITISTDLAVVRGLNTVSAVASATKQMSCADSKFLMTLRRIEVEWKITQLMWSNQPIPC